MGADVYISSAGAEGGQKNELDSLALQLQVFVILPVLVLRTGNEWSSARAVCGTAVF